MSILVKGPTTTRHTWATTLHAVLSTTALYLRLPFHLLWHFVLARSTSPIVQELGRSPLGEAAALFTRHTFLKLYLAPSRTLFGLGASPEKGWVTHFDNGVIQADWIAPPDSPSKKEEGRVFYWIHGGAFTHDPASSTRPVFVELAKMLQARGINFSIFQLDYSLAPDYVYPTQLRQVLAGYRHLVDDLGIPEERICIGGDSAGGNLVAAFLLHLARPSKRIQPPEDQRPTPQQPGAALFISPFVDLVSYNATRAPSFPLDFIDDGAALTGALRYVGAVEPYPDQVAGSRRGHSWNPLRWFANGTSGDPPPRGLVDLSVGAASADESDGLELLASPYVNPHAGTVKDLAWYKEAFPGHGRTFVTWGGVEIFSGDIELWVDALKKAGVAPTELCKPLGAHDWPIFDASVPTASRTKDGGESSERDYGLRQIAEFLARGAKEDKQA